MQKNALDLTPEAKSIVKMLRTRWPHAFDDFTDVGLFMEYHDYMEEKIKEPFLTYLGIDEFGNDIAELH